MEYKKFFKNIIYKWVAKNFGESEAEDPSWSIDALAEELAKYVYNLYHDIEYENEKENVKWVAEEIMDEQLTNEQLASATREYMNDDSYGSLTDDIQDMIAHYVEEQLTEEQ